MPLARRFCARIAATAAVVVLALAVTATPVAAHAGDAQRATNYQTTLTSVPDLPGLTVAVGDSGTTIELRYEGPGEVIVYGYGVDPEPYLRIGADGVFRNLQSNATYMNDSLTADTPIPPGVDPENPPEWERVDTDPTASWHDHRAHWMGVVDPPAVTAAPTEDHVVIDDWSIPLTVDGRPAEIRGDVTWVPGPAPWPWVVGIVIATGAAVAVALRTRPGFTLEAGLLAGVASASLALGFVLSPVDPPWWWAGGVIITIGVLSAAVLALEGGRRRAGTLLAGAGGLAAAALVGFVDRAWLVRSLLPVEVHPFVGRAVVATSFVLGGGLAIAALWWVLGPGRIRPR